MAGYKPEQRSFPTRILTTAGWLSGTFHLPARSRLVEQLNRPTVFFRLTDVTLHGRNESVPFLALQRHEMIIVLPPETETDLQYTPEVEPLAKHEVTCLLELGLIHGTIETLKGIRVSDFFLNKQGFVLLEKCRLRLGSLQTRNVTDDEEARAIVNASRVLGISDTPEVAGIGAAE